MRPFFAGLLGLGCLLQTLVSAQVPLSKTLDSVGTLEPARQRILLRQHLRGWPTGSMPKDTTYIRLVVDLARAHALTDDLPQAIRYLKFVIAGVNRREIRSSPASDVLLKAYYRLMYVQLQGGRMADALQTGQRGLGLARQYSRSKWASNLYTTLAYVRSTEGDYEQAHSFAERGTYIGVLLQDAFCMANGFFEQAKAMRSLKRLDRAHWAIDRAIVVGRKHPDKVGDLSLYYAIKASLYQMEKRYADTEFWFEQAIALNRSQKDTSRLASNYTDLGYFYSVTEQYAPAILVLNEAVGLRTYSNVRAVALDNLGVAYQKMGRTTTAIQTLQQAIRELIPVYKARSATELPDSVLIRSAPNKEFLLAILGDLADVWLQQGIRQQSPNSSGVLANALRTFALADQLVDYMRWEHTGQQSKLYWREKTRSLYEGAIETCFRLDNPTMAYRFMEKSRAVLLTDNLNELGARQQLPPQLAQQEQTLNQKVTSLRAQVAAEKSGTTAYNRALAELLLAQEKSDAFVQQMKKTHTLYYQYRYDNAVRPLVEVQTWLRTHNQSVVTYFVGDSALYVLGITASGSRLLRQPIYDYTCGIQNWLSLLNNPTALNSQFPQFVQNGADLYQLLLAPLQLPTGRVVVSPDGFFVPFEALTRSRSVSTPDYLVSTYAFSYVYSVNRLLAEPAVTTSQTQFVGMAPQQFARTQTQSALPDLPGSVESLERIGAHYFMPTLLKGPLATRSQFRALAPTATIVQLFTHADADTLRREPVIYFADSTLHLSDLQTGPAFETQLLVLSACRTGVGSHQKGEGVFSLARGFAALGVPSMLTTLWSVETQPTYTLTESFYDLLAAGLTKDVALQQAKKDWLRTASRANKLPHMWAGLILIGDPSPLRQPQDRLAMATGWVGWSITGGLLLLMLVLIGYSRKRIRINRFT